MKKPRTHSLIERAVLAQQWSAIELDATLHALIGDDSDNMVDLAGRVMFVVLGAAMASGFTYENPDVRIVVGAVNALHDQAGEKAVDGTHRASIVSGLQAAARLKAQLSQRAIVDAACDLTLKLRRQDVHLSDFQKLVPQRAEAAA